MSAYETTRSLLFGSAATTSTSMMLAFLACLFGGAANVALAEQEDKPPEANAQVVSGSPSDKLLHTPVSKLFPAHSSSRPDIENPVANDPQAVQRGMKFYKQFNCVGCHAANGGGGMGPSLSNSTFIYGSQPENIYLSILQGRPNGMPAWGSVIPDQVIWDLVAYIQSISKEPSGSWGKTTSVKSFSIEQVPFEYLKTTQPWKHTQPFSYGQSPYEKAKNAPPPSVPK